MTFSLPRETFFHLIPPEVLRPEHVQNLIHIDDLQRIPFDEHLSRYAIGEYKPAIINENLCSFFRYTLKETYLIIIDKRSTGDVQRYNFYSLFSTFGKGRIHHQSVMPSVNSASRRETINLTNVFIDVGQVLILELCHLHDNYDDREDWWMRGVIYEIIVASYQDSNGDGYGDLQGIRQRLDYIQSIGVKTIWLTPFQPTTWKDYGYDICHFCEVDPRFGTLDDFRQLVKDVHARNMRIIIDFVPNHTSSEHPWFQRALLNDPKYVDYYIWHKGKNGGKDPPTNWVGASGQRMWTYSPERKMFYLHQFLDCQPDLNYRNENVLKEMESILRFWLDLGIDGFRIDAVRHLIEDDRYRDEPRDPSAPDADPEVMYHAYKHTETADQEGSYALVRHWRKFLDDYTRENNRDYILLVTEAYNRDVEKVMKFFSANRMERGTDIAINFFFTYYLDLDRKKKDGLALDEQISNWLNNLQEGAWSNWCLGSHDSRRVTTRLPSPEMIDGFYMLLLLQIGTGLVYYGDEIAMQDRPFTLAERDAILDITAFNYGEKNVEAMVRDCQRTPMQWSGSLANAGFTSATTKPFLPLAETWSQCNVEEQSKAKRSHLKLFQQLVRLREQAPFYGGHQKKLLATKELHAFVRWLDQTAYLVVINVNPIVQKEVKSDFRSLLGCDKTKECLAEIVAQSCQCSTEEGQKVDLKEIVLRSCDALVLKLLLPVDEIPFCH